MSKHTRTLVVTLAAWLAIPMLSGSAADDLARQFAAPPPAARPWVYWFWLNGNITREGITADLEALQRAGLGGALIMEVDQGAPVGPVDFMSPAWRELFRHVHAEANRLGLEINMNDDAGWNGSGGPWIKPEQSMQEVTWSETQVTGPRRFEAVLPQPKTTAAFYRDIAVQAIPAVDAFRIPGIESKAAFQRRGIHPASQGQPTPQSVVARGRVQDLTANLDAHGRLVWEVPAGEWTILRIGHTSTGAENAPAPKSGRGLECDKLSQQGSAANFDGMMARLAADTGIAARPATAGLVATHIDSWENGSQNWTAQMRAEFQQRRGYDLTPWLPVFTGRVVESLELSERFLWDLRQTISELVIENYAGHFRSLANRHGMRFTVEAYGSPCDYIPYAGQSDEPMGEFWTPGGMALETCRGMASAGHVYGKRIVGAEAFTSDDKERWREHPAVLKSLGDRAFCEGINRFVFHRYAMQPWLDRRPGMTMGPWGQHYERTQTWWEQSRAWHEYLARCQFLLRQGLFVADLCYLLAEAPPQGFGRHPQEGYAWDECTADAVLNRMTVRDGRLVLPDGMSYRLLVLPESQTMTPRLLAKVQDLVEAGATVLGPRPLKSPSLNGYPECDAKVQRLAGALWGDCDGQRVFEHRSGRGRVVWGPTPERLLQREGVPPDFTCSQPWRFLHRSTDTAEIYFVANSSSHEAAATCAFRVTGRVPELWSPETGCSERAGIYAEQDGVTRVVLSLEPSGSVFVVFRQPAAGAAAITELRRDGKTLLSAKPAPPPKLVVRQARYGVLNDPQRTRDVQAKVQAQVDAGDCSFPVAAMAKGDDPAPLVRKTLAVEFTVDAQPYTAQAQDGDTIRLTRNAVGARVVKALYGVLGDPQRTRDVRVQVQRRLDAGERAFIVAAMAAGDDPAFGVIKTLDVEYTLAGKQLHLTGVDPETLDFLTDPVPPAVIAQVRGDAEGRLRLEAREPGVYELVTASGQPHRLQVAAVPPPVELSGPWEVCFDAKWGGPAQPVTFERLQDWSQRAEPGIRYYSGVALYRKSFQFPEAALQNLKTQISKVQPKLLLDLGQVAVMADVTLNGRSLGTLWKPPYRVEVTDALQPGENTLELRVVNLWINRQIGDEQLPEDSDRNADGTLKSWPAWLAAGQPSPTGRFTFTSWRLWKKDSPLAPSGLLGPVLLRVSGQIPVPQ